MKQQLSSREDEMLQQAGEQQGDRKVGLEKQGNDEVWKNGVEDRVLDGSVARPCCSLTCRTIRVGNYKVFPNDELTVTPSGIQFKVPGILDRQEVVTIAISMKDILKVLAHFGKTMPILFLSVSEDACARVRRQLNMLNSQAFYLDVQSLDETQKRITVLLEKLTEEKRVALKQLFESKLQEVDHRDANDILVRNSPRDIAKLKAGMNLTWAAPDYQDTSVAPASPWLFLTPSNDDEGNN